MRLKSQADRLFVYELVQANHNNNKNTPKLGIAEPLWRWRTVYSHYIGLIYAESVTISGRNYVFIAMTAGLGIYFVHVYGQTSCTHKTYLRHISWSISIFCRRGIFECAPLHFVCYRDSGHILWWHNDVAFHITSPLCPFRHWWIAEQRFGNEQLWWFFLC